MGRMKMRPILRLLTGAAGTGKTSRCIELFRDRILVSGSSGLSTSSYFILPNKEHTDRIHDLLTRDERVLGLAQHHLLPIGDFMRFKCWTGRDRVVSQFERRWLARQALDSRPWSWMAKSAGTAGMAECMANFLREWKSSGAQADGLSNAFARLRAAGSDGEKTSDLQGFCEAYEAAKQAAGFRDPEDMAADFARQSEGLTAPDLELVVFDGFFSLTEQQMLFVQAVAARSKEVVVTLTLPDSGTREDAFVYPLRLRERLLKIGFAEERLSKPSRRFRAAGLALLEAGLFVGKGEVSTDAADASDVSGVRRIEAATRRQEVEAIAREMTANVRGGRCHWSDQMAVFRGMRAYQPYVEEVFGAMGVPYELHERSRLSDHPAVRRMVEWMDLIEVSESGPIIRVHRWALWMNAGRNMEALDALPARLEWAQVPERFVEMDSSAQVLWRREYARMRDFLSLGSAADLKFFLESLLDDCCGSARLPATLKAKTLARELIERQTVRPIPDAAAAQAAALRLRGDLEAGLYSTGTRRKNRVQVYDTSLAMLKEYRIVFVGGLNHGEFPAAHREDTLLHDRERKVLRELGIHLDTAEDRRRGEGYFFYMAVTRAAEEVVLTRHSTDDQGRPTAASAWWTEVQRVFGGLVPTREIGAAELVPGYDQIKTPRELLKALGAETAATFASYPVQGRGVLAESWDQLDAAARERGGHPELYSNFYERSQRLRRPAVADIESLDAAGAVRRKPWSATEAQSLLQCRYKYFAQYGIGLRPQVLTTPVMREGELWHKALENLLRFWGGKPLPEREVFLRQAGPAMEAALGEYPLVAERFYLKEARVARIRRRWPIIAAAEWENCRASSGLVPTLFEAGFGLMRNGRASEKGAFEVSVGGHKLQFQGQIDRVDADPVTGRALAADYKSGKGFERKDLDKGMLFQSVLYTLALKHVWGYEPIGTEYVSLKNFKRAGLLREDLYREARPSTRLKSLMEPEAFETFISRSLETLVEDWKRYRSGSIAAEALSCRNCDYYPLCRYEKRKTND